MKDYLLMTHIVAGAVNLLSGLLIIVLNKGTRLHVRLGRVFFYSMLVVAVSAMAMIILRPNYFLVAIGLFSGYMTLSGTIAIRRDYERLRIFMWPLIAAGVGVSCRMLLSGHLILMIFGSIQALFCVTDIRLLIRKPSFSQRRASHIGKMMGAFIASFTAFLVNAVNIPGGWYLWLVPTVVFVPLIVFWQVRLKSARV